MQDVLQATTGKTEAARLRATIWIGSNDCAYCAQAGVIVVVVVAKGVDTSSCGSGRFLGLDGFCTQLNVGLNSVI